jgi:hypothetical protein
MGGSLFTASGGRFTIRTGIGRGVRSSAAFDQKKTAARTITWSAREMDRNSMKCKRRGMRVYKNILTRIKSEKLNL